MATDFYIKQNDTAPAIAATLKDSTGTAVDLSGASVQFHMNEPDGTSIVDAAATVVDAPNGRVQYSWSPADTANAGHFLAEWEVTYSTGKVESFPSDRYLTIDVLEDLA